MILNITLILLYPLLIYFFPFIDSEKNESTDIISLCPDKNEMKNYQPISDPEIAVGEDLYLIINGGAEIYNEYGFNKALFQTYSNRNGNFINLEIYEMKDNAAAFGIFSFKRSISSSTLKLGYEGSLDSYYLNFWKGNYLVTLTSMKTDSSYSDELIRIADIVDKKIKSNSTPPKLIKLIPVKNLLSNGITYLRGYLSFFNQDIFKSNNIFQIKEGILGHYPDHKILIIKYLNNQESNNIFENVKTILKNDESYHSYKKYKSYYEISNKNKFAIKPLLNFILVIIGKETLNSTSYFQLIEENIKTVNLAE